MHSLMLINSYQPEQPNVISWVKIFTWRRNGDGINPFGNTLIEDCFIRTQDDCVYVNGLGIRRVVFGPMQTGLPLYYLLLAICINH